MKLHVEYRRKTEDEAGKPKTGSVVKGEEMKKSECQGSSDTAAAITEEPKARLGLSKSQQNILMSESCV